MTASLSPPKDASAMPGAPTSAFSSAANELSREPHVSTGATPQNGYNNTVNSMYTYTMYTYTPYTYTEKSKDIIAPASQETTDVVSARIKHSLFLRLQEHEKLTGKSRSDIIEEALTLHLANTPMPDPEAIPQPSVISQIKNNKAREELTDHVKSLYRILATIRDGCCDKTWPSIWYHRFNQQFIKTVQKLEPLSPEEEILVKVMSTVSKAARDLDPTAEDAYQKAKALLAQLKQAEEGRA